MKKAIAIGMMGLVFASVGAAAQTGVERAQILREFQQSVVDYTQQRQCLALFPGDVSAASPAAKIFTLPVAMVFRQIIAGVIAGPEGAAIIARTGAATERPAVRQPFPASDLTEFPTVLSQALPSMPAPLEYRLIGNDLVIRDAEGDVIVAVLRSAIGITGTKH